MKIDSSIDITVANNETVKTYGLIENLQICVNEQRYTCEAIVLKHTAQDLLLGTNFLSKYNCKIDFGTKELKIPRSEDIYNIIKLSTS